MHKPTLLLALFLAATGTTALAHHSFAVYDIDNKIERTGILTKFRFANPHIMLELEATLEDGSKETWVIESMNLGRWDRNVQTRDVAKVGEKVTIHGWPARDGSDTMALSTITTERGTTVVIEQVQQSRARENIPAVTIKRE